MNCFFLLIITFLFFIHCKFFKIFSALFPSKVRRVIPNKINLCVCVRLWQVKGEKKHQWSIRCFSYPAVFQSCFDRLGVRTIRFVHARNSTNQVSKGWQFSELGFEGLDIQAIRFRAVENSVNQFLRSCDFDQSGFVKHDLKGVLKCLRVEIWTLNPAPPPQTVTDATMETS